MRGRVADVMTPEPFTVRDNTNLEAAARILLRLKVAFAAVSPPVCWLCTRAMRQRNMRLGWLSSARTWTGCRVQGRGPAHTGADDISRCWLSRLLACAGPALPTVCAYYAPAQRGGWCNTRLRAQIRRLPVVDEEGRLVGMFTRSDVIRAALRLRRAAQDLVV